MLNSQSKNHLQATSLVFIDSHLDNYQFLAQGIINDIEVIILNPTENGVDKITETLQKKVTSQTKIEAIHIFSHGSPGNLQLGNTFLNLDTLKTQEKLIKNWKTALTETANILLYGCNVAANLGIEFVNKLSQILEVNIAASIDLTGSKLLGGNWNLEFTTGEIVAKNPLKPEIMAAYNGTLATLTVTNNNDSGTGSLREAIATAQSGDTIEFDPSVANQTITLTSGQLEIDKDLIIDGVNAPNLIISGNNTSRIIDLKLTPILEKTTLTIKNLTIANGKTSEIAKAGAGAGIRTENYSELIVENSTFLNNYASGRGGGAIYSGYRSKTTIINSKFDNNDSSQALNESSELSESGGGAILNWSESDLTIQGSEFINNKGINGGAINNLLSSLTIEDSTFKNNDSTINASTNHGYGGAIYTDGASSGTIRISNSLIEGNKGAGQGGGLFLFSYNTDQVIVENSTIIDNHVIENAQGFANGGGLRTGIGNVDITNTTFANNLALRQGGGLWMGGDATNTITNSTFSGNNALNVQLNADHNPIVDSDGNYVLNGESQGLGGAMTLSGNTTINNSTFANNYAGGYGGVFWGGTSATVANSIFDNNTSGNPYNINTQTHQELYDGGGNIQYPGLAGNNDTKITANIIVADPLLGELQEVNGVLVHPLLEGSPAIDAGVNTNAPTTDQLGNTRPVDGDNNGSSITDIGAVEFIPTPFITGDDSDNSLNGTSDDDSIDGLGGNDTLKGAAGNDTINGGDGNDTLGGGIGNDVLNGNAGNDSLTGWWGNDIIDGGDGFDTLQGGDDADTLNGGGDADTLKGGTGN
ncbi:MAG: DUF4347 domain-containing protein, partial [Trichodesmium sp.]